jgi:ribosome-associated protein
MDNNINTGLPSSLKNAEPIEIANTIIRVLDLKKARELKLLRVADHTVIADFFVICEGTSTTNIKALAGEVEYKLGLCGVAPIRIDGHGEGQWIVLDFGSVLVHIMSREYRDFYKLEKLWSDAETVDIKDLLIN